MFKRPFSRGSSILAALVFIGILSAIAFAVQSVSPSANPRAQSAATATVDPSQPKPCDGGEKRTKIGGSATAENVQEQCLPGCIYVVNPGSGSTASPKVSTSVKFSNPKQPAPQSCIVKYCTDPKNTANCPQKIVEIGLSDENQKAANDSLNKTLSDYQKQALAQGTVNGVLGAGSNGSGGSAESQINGAISNYYKSGGDQATLDSAFKGAQADAQSQQNCSDPTAGCFTPSSAQDQLAKIDLAQKASDACNNDPTGVCQGSPSLGQPDLKLNPDLKNGDGLSGNDTCPIGGQNVGCNKSTGELYVTPEEKAAVVNAGYSCGLDSSGGTDYSYACTKSKVDANGNKVGPDKTGFKPGPETPTPPPSKTDAGGGGMGALSSILQGLMKGLTGAQTAPAQACPTDPNAYQQQQQQYNQQLQQYNQQLQQYNYQQQMSQYNGMPAPIAPVAPSPCQQTSSSNTCAAAPAQPAASGCANGTWRPISSQQSNGASCTTGWQCVPGGSGVTPTAQLSCQPQIADVGMSIAISYSCTNATDSVGSGFDTAGATSGSTTTVITTPPAGTNTANLGITCRNQGLVGQAQCSVQVGKPSIVLVANPKIVTSGASSTIGWITSGMKTCVVSSPDMADFTATNANNTSVNGMAVTPPITADAGILLHCVTVAGGTRDATTTVQVATSTTQ